MKKSVPKYRGQRISHADLVAESRETLRQAGVGNHERAMFITELSRAVVGHKSPLLYQIQPRVKFHTQKEWKKAYDLVFAYIAEHNLEKTLETIGIEMGETLQQTTQRLANESGIDFSYVLNGNRVTDTFNERVQKYTKIHSESESESEHVISLQTNKAVQSTPKKQASTLNEDPADQARPKRIKRTVKKSLKKNESPKANRADSSMNPELQEEGISSSKINVQMKLQLNSQQKNKSNEPDNSEQQRLLSKQQREQQLREQRMREQQIKEQKLKEKELREQQLREEQKREQQLREQKLKEQQLKEEKLREQQLKEQKLREQQLKEQKLREQQLKEQKLREQQLKEQQLKEQKLREQQLKEQRDRERQLKQQREREQQLNDQRKRHNDQLYNPNEMKQNESTLDSKHREKSNDIANNEHQQINEQHPRFLSQQPKGTNDYDPNAVAQKSSLKYPSKSSSQQEQQKRKLKVRGLNSFMETLDSNISDYEVPTPSEFEISEKEMKKEFITSSTGT